MRKLQTDYLALMFAVAATAAAPAAAQDGPARAITHVSGDVYRFQNGGHFGVFLATAEGIAVFDPINREAADWLKGELAARFDAPVKYVVYSHFHADHASGAAAFPEAKVVAHSEAARALTPPAAGAPLDVHDAELDANGDGRLQKAELPEGLDFEAMDADGDGGITAREGFLATFGDVRRPDETYEGRKTLTLGGKSADLIHVGGGHSSDMTFAYFPAEKVLFVVDVLATRRLPYRTMTGFAEADYRRYFDTALALPFTVVVPGHGEMGGREDLLAHRQYIEDLVAGVRAGVAAGKSLEDIQATLLLEDYKDWAHYDAWRQENIAGVHAALAGAD